jgi:hypothetical protein
VRSTLFGWLTAAVLVSGTALAQQDEVMIRAARDLGNEGIDLFEKGDYAGSMDRLERAYRVIHVPTLGLWYARALAKNGRLIEASERYLEASRIPPKPDDPAIFAESRQQALAENDALQARIPKLEIRIDGAPAAEVSVTVDGKPIAAVLIGMPFAVNPGQHQVAGKRGPDSATQTVTLTEGGKETTVLTFGAKAPAPAEAAPEVAPKAAPAAAVSGPPGKDAGVSSGGSSQSTWAFVAFGVGGAGLITGGVTHLMAKGKQSDLEEVCGGTRCPSSAQSDLDSYQMYRTVALVGGIVGGVGVVAGTVLLITAPSDPPKSARIEPWIGIGSAGVRGAF